MMKRWLIIRAGWIILLSLAGFSFSAVYANNIRVVGNPSVQVSGGALEVSFRLSWDNAWRDEFNWDAAWVFVKWKKDGAAGGWNALSLNTAGHEAGDAGSGLTCQPEGTAGAFIYWSGASARDVTEQTVRLKAPLPSGVSADDVANRKLYISVFATEMVLVPYGAFYAGDGASAASFSDAAGQPYLVNSESITNVYALSPGGGTPVSLFSSAPSLPKGYKGFYAMKYEVSQEQYVHYLNTLSYTEQKARIGNDLDALQVGNYIFGDPHRPSCRNGIAVFSKENTTSPAVFACNLNPDDPFSSAGDGQTIACNYLTSGDLDAYCTWSGLRAMSEFEYEKLSRPVGQVAVARSYAWGSTGLSPFTDASLFVGGTVGTEQEHFTADGLNANARNAFGPVRCGSFGSASSSQEQAGAGFYGAMELSGNVSELCLKATSGYCLRGGSFASPDSLLCTSNRSVLTAPATRDSTVGFRAVRTVTPVSMGSGSLTVTGGGGATVTSVCPGAPVTVTGPAVTVPDGLNVQYSWCVNDVLVPGASEESLIYSGFEIKKSYVFKRKAICPLGEAEHSSSSITVVVPPLLAGSIGTAGNKTTVCPKEELLIRNITNAGYGGSCPFDSVITYSWYVNNTLLPNQSGDTLLYSAFVSGTNYVFTRRATSVVGFVEVKTGSLSVTNPSIKLNSSGTEINACGNTTPVVASPVVSGVTPTYTWLYNDSPIPGVSGNTYTASASHFDNKVGTYNVTVRGTLSGCIGESILSVIVMEPARQTFVNCGDKLLDCAGGSYSTKSMADGRCWMVQDLKYGNCNASDYTSTNSQSSVSGKIGTGLYGVCRPNSRSDAGFLYNWQAAMQQSDTYYGSSTAPTGRIRGICPIGWHLPSSSEFQQLYTDLGENPAAINPGGVWQGVLGGYCSYDGSLRDQGSNGDYWGSTGYSGGSAYLLYFVSGHVVPQSNTAKCNGLSVRCLKDY